MFMGVLAQVFLVIINCSKTFMCCLNIERLAMFALYYLFKDILTYTPHNTVLTSTISSRKISRKQCILFVVSS